VQIMLALTAFLVRSSFLEGISQLANLHLRTRPVFNLSAVHSLRPAHRAEGFSVFE